MESEYANLGELRERLLGYRPGGVARLAGLSEARLREIECGADAPTLFEVECLSRLYGIDPDTLSEEPIRLGAGDGVEVLALQPEFREVADSTKARIIAVANAARDLVTLRVLLGLPDARQQFLREAPRLAIRRPPGSCPPAMTRPRGDDLPYAQGRLRAGALRRAWKLDGPVASVRDLVATHLPPVAVFYAHLGVDDDVAGLTFTHHQRGPAIVLNLDGRNESPGARRFSLAHELCHLLVDWNRMQPLSILSIYKDDSRLEVERRANAFAARLLCPESTVSALVKARGGEAACAALLREWGMHYQAARLYLRNAAGVELPLRPSAEHIEASARGGFLDAERPLALHGFPVDEVPPERRTLVARHAAQAYSEGRIPRDRFAEYLGVPPSAEVERVLDFLALDSPGTDADAT